MKRLMDRIDRFCLLHPRFGIRRLMLYIVIGNIIVFALRMMDGSGLIYPLLRFSGQGILHGDLAAVAADRAVCRLLDRHGART